MKAVFSVWLLHMRERSYTRTHLSFHDLGKVELEIILLHFFSSECINVCLFVSLNNFKLLNLVNKGAIASTCNVLLLL